MLPTSRTDKRSSYTNIDIDQHQATTSATSPYAATSAINSSQDVPAPYRKRYIDSQDALLPTYSPPASTYLAQDSPGRMSSPGPNARRFAAGFDPYSSSSNVDADSYSDSAALKAKEAGFAPPPSGAAKVNKYDHLIPVHKQRTPNFELIAWTIRQEEVIGLIYTILSLVTRLWGIGNSNVVVWDEAHFGKFGSHYLQQEFYFDVHPPLGKMLVGLAGLISGYRGQFEFKSGETYPADVNYIGMRIILAMFGVAMVPLAWFTSGGLNWNWRARHLLTIMVLLDNGWLVISRFILLDSMLLCFTLTTVHGLVKFLQYKSTPFSKGWWFWLAFTGASIGCVTSVKWVGLFATALVGVFTVEDLWEKFGDLRMPVRTYARHWCARILCLIFLPMTIYMLSFKAHFLILSRSGPGDAQMSSLFQSHLRGNDFALSPPEAAFGSKITLKNMGYGGGLLHSHVQTYPVGSQQQQVTCYHYRDNNNEFIITPPWGEQQLPANYSSSEEPIRMLKNNDIIRIVHDQTKRNIHSHNVAAPVTKENLEVSGYGDAEVGDDNDHWVVEVVDDMVHGKVPRGGPVRSLTTRLRLRHKNLNCYMRAANAVLPQWGWKQVEVSCDKENNPKDQHTWWNIENHWNDRLPPGDSQLYKSPFLRDFIHLNVAMMTSNNALIPDADKEDILASKPFDWPFLWNGLRMNSWDDNSIKFYLLGNPVIWWSSSFSLLAFAGTWLWYMMRRQRRIQDLSPTDWSHFLYVAKLAGFGWILHYLPFLIMARVCYLHHYLPILYFAVLMLVHLMDHFFWRRTTAVYSFGGKKGRREPLGEGVKNAVFVGSVVAVAGAFWWFRGNSYGFKGDISGYKGLKWRKSWNIY
ncbi:glycosyltransferase [Pseudozyma hubeiensis SY62]|uniref:Dolichyl-phosphate-mannose--protein mannosyltransferase n=1 Tax=Pseudozyma hubeiensis (strain SY62) TaxID=1305764 RepID=R9P919_PSEHS|nr:glycosyltransferase [Pseudozyma hubeiensis SY62]GAC97757.1 glycosyltransferase [Pseudozyma hubeiensis SY62]